MSSTKFFQFPWATYGDKASIPDTVQVDGSVSYPEGFGVDYELELGVDAAALPVPRPETNQLYYDLTSNIRAWQLAGLPEWATAAQNGGVAVTYPKSAMVRHDYTGAFLAYFANVATDDEPGTSADWSTLLTSSTSLAFVPLAGGIMTGLLTLSGAPTAALHAATKAYVDAAALGNGQSWQSVSRSAGVVYQNTTPGPIAVSVNNSANGSGFVYVGPSNPPTVPAYVSGGSTTPGTGGIVIIPKGHYYNTGGVIYIFAELRP